jgi:hypothetical protein
MSRSYADMVSKVLRQDAPLPPRFPADRERLVAAVERGLRARRRHQQLVRWTMTASAAAAALILVVGGRTLLSPYTPAPIAGAAATSASHGLKVLSSPEAQGASGVMVGAGAAVPLAEGMTLPQGFRLVAPPAGEVRIGAARGTTLTLEGGGELAVKEANVMQRYELREGAVRARVAKLIPGERFIIATSDAEVEVHGTAFRVAVVPADPSCGAGTITRVSVTEGVVSVRRDGVEVRVTPGHVWPERCELSPAVTTTAAHGGSSRAHARQTSSVTSSARATVARSAGLASGVTAPAAGTNTNAPSVEPAAPVAPAESPQPVMVPLSRSELAAQNDLFGSAVRAKRHGLGWQAVRIFERFDRLYPASPLAESAAAQRMKLLTVIDAVAARRAATEYLSRYPGGFARAEARHLLDTP